MEDGNVINLSSYTLSADETRILAFGSSFIPTYKLRDCAIDDIQDFARSIKIKDFFRDFHRPKPIFYNKKRSSWVPPEPSSGNVCSLLSALAQLGTEDTFKMSSPTQSNLTKQEDKALNDLLKLKNIVIKPADKSGCFVVMDKSDYIDKVNSLLEDRNTYQEVEEDFTLRVADDVEGYLLDIQQRYNMKSQLIKQLKPPREPRTSQFYILPKTHKEGNPPRPIVSACDYATGNISEFISQLITPLAKKNPTYLGSTKEFVELIRDLPHYPKSRYKNFFLVTADISSMYTNIPHDQGIDSILRSIDNNRSSMPAHTPHNRVIKMFLHFILKQNYFQFMDKYYLQVEGVAMGCKLAPALANIFMYDLEKDMLQPYMNVLEVWRRYIDDIFFIWIKSLKKLNEFMDHCNSFHPSIKYTFTFSSTEVDFMDVKIIRDVKTGKLDTTVYRKPSRRNTYLHQKSFHPAHIFNNIVYNQAIRYRAINSTDNRFHAQLSQLKWNFRRRDYCKMFIVKQFKRASLSRSKVRTNRKNNRSIMCRLAHGINTKYRIQSILRLWQLHFEANQVNDIDKERPDFVQYNHPNLKKLLVRAKTT